jgi:hypothetical protein
MAITVEPTFEQSRSRVMSGSRRVALLGVLVFTVGCAPTPI